MNMESVIGEQHITHRRKSAASVKAGGGSNFFWAIGLPNTARTYRETPSGSAGRHRSGHLPGTHDSPRSKTVPRLFFDQSAVEKHAFAIHIKKRPDTGASQPVARDAFIGRKAKLLAVGFVALLAASFVIAASGADRTPDLSGFSLPDDKAAIALIIDSLSGREHVPDESQAMPELPLTLSVSSYKIMKNDTIDGISRRFGVRLDTLISLNGISNVRRIQAGTVIKVPNIDGVIHTVSRGDSLSFIAATSGLSVLDIVDANDLSSQVITPGQVLFLPGARLPSYDLKKALGTLIAWPLRGRLSSNYGYRSNPFTNVRQFHNGIDIVASLNSAAHAAMDGRVAEIGYSTIFGNFIILTHSGGYQTLYAHMNKISVRKGQNISQGMTIGLTGSTGYSTGPHLHFGLFKNGVAIDPLKMLGS